MLPVSIISKNTISRLLQDVKGIIKTPLSDNGIYYKHDEEDILKGYALIIGPEDTPYFGGNYLFEINYPTNYPYSPPKVTYCTNGDNIRFNPNLYKCGKVCISILNTWQGEQWSSCQTISTLLLTLCTLLCNNPLLNEPGITNTHCDYKKYTTIIEYKNIEIAILKIINKTPGIYIEKFECFYLIMFENFLKNMDKLQKYLEDKSKKTNLENITTTLYSMYVVINYQKLLILFNETCDKINNKIK